ncbi:MAG: SusC/RagA family TonB-linked outer membrane protein [Crocinitomicaceae bacterium]|nr:SusC/RagA family TonB-linked outer membrane protein [Crocinitomicaceae bacterium]
MIRKLLFTLLSLLFVSLTTHGQTSSIIGKITDVEGLPVYPATLVLEGKGMGAQTNENGEFEIKFVPAGTVVLIVRASGFVTYSQEIIVSSGTVLNQNITLTKEAKEYDEVVVIGYGTTRTKDLTGAATVITEKNFLQGSLATPEQLIMGKVAGLKVTSNDGAPGSGSTLRLRGGTSINASNDPLIVIDGVPIDNGGIAGAANPLSLVNPNDIASFVILKDASATAIYGARAANGVILITTKKGSASQKEVHVTLNSKISISTIAKYAEVLSGDSLRTLINRQGSQQQIDLLGAANTDWQKEVFRTAITSDNNVSITGGIIGLPYRLSVANRFENGLLKRDNMNRTSLGLNLNPTFLDGNLQLEVNQKMVQSRAFFANRGALGAAFFDPTQAVQSGNNNLFGGYFEWIDNGKPNVLSARNPLGLIMQSEDRSVVNRYIGNAKVTYKMPFLPMLKATVNLGTDQSEGTGYTITDSLSAAGYFTQGSYSQYRQTKGNKLIEAYANFNTGEKYKDHLLDLTAGYSYQDWYTSSPNNASFNQAQDSIIGQPAANPFYTKNALLSFYARGIYTFKNQFVVNLSMRRDGSSRFSSEQRWGWFPAASAAWLLSEGFLKDVKEISMLKIRVGYGVTGQQDGIGDYAYIGNYFEGATNAQYAFGGQYYTVFRPAGYDANLKWETTSSINIGLDFGLYKDRFSGSIDVYRKSTSDLLATVAVPAGTNFTNQILTNVGGMQNQGIEVSLNTGLIAKKNMRLDWMVNFTRNFNEVTKLSQIEDPNSPGILVGGIAGGIGNQVLIHQVGQPTFTYFVYEQQYEQDGSLIEVGQQASIDMNGDGTINTSDKWKDTNAFVDRNNDGIINIKDRYYAGQVAPKFFMGTAFNFQYGKWNAGVSMRSEIGGTIYNNIHSNSATFSAIDGTKKFLSNISSLFYEDEVQKTTTNQLLSDHYLERADFLRIDNISVGYNFGKLGFTKDKVGVNVGFSVQNVFVFTRYSGQDPEVGGGVDNNFYPRPRVYTLNLNFDF